MKKKPFYLFLLFICIALSTSISCNGSIELKKGYCGWSCSYRDKYIVLKDGDIPLEKDYGYCKQGKMEETGLPHTWEEKNVVCNRTP